jgi:hypothetical protein
MSKPAADLKAGSGISRFLTLMLPIVVASACVWMARPQAAAERGDAVSNDRTAVQSVRANHPASLSDATPVSLTAASPKLMTRPIEDIRPGMRVLASNPGNAGVDVQRLEIADVTDWRLIRYQMPKPDGSYLFVDMLRHTDELEGQSVGAFSPLSFPELAIEGDAEITAINVCPLIESGSGYLVTAKFTHTAANVIDLRVASESEPIGTTSNHPFWSEDRQDWVQAGELQLGEQLQLIDGTRTQVASIAENPETQPVYDLTVDAQHTYHVGASGVLVHNSSKYVSGGIYVVDIRKLQYPSSRPFADASKLLKQGSFDITKYTPPPVLMKPNGVMTLQNGVTRIENAKRAGIFELPVQIFTR